MFKNKKIFVTLISLLSCISLLSVGYASWTIVSNSAFGEASGDITADNVMYSNNYVTVEKDQPLLYCNYGFVERNNTHNLSNKGNLRVAINLKNLDQFKNTFNGKTLGVEVNLKFDNSKGAFDLFNSDSSLPLSVSVLDSSLKLVSENPDVTNLNQSKHLNIYTVKFDIPLTGISDQYYINYEWTNTDSNANALDIDKNNWFYKSGLSSTLNRKDLFSFNTKLESKGGNQ